MTHTPEPYGKTINGVWWTQIALDNLYAAAPELLGALKAVNRHNSFAKNKFPLGVMEPVRAAIAKAEGKE